jgi:hypothetical protein
MIAPFFADVDTSSGGTVYYRTDTVDGHPAFAATWLNVGYFNQHTAPVDIFQVVLISRGEVALGAFDVEFNYGQLPWETGDGSGGTGGLGGTSARAGLSNGTGNANTYVELPGSGVNGALLDTNPFTGLIYGSHNTTVTGRDVYAIRLGGGPLAPVGSRPAITKVSPTSGSTAGGTSVRLTGSGFTAVRHVYFGVTEAATFHIDSDSQITVTAPAHAAGTVDVRVVTATTNSPITTADQYAYTNGARLLAAVGGGAPAPARRVVARGLTRSAEAFTDFVTAAYQNFLGRVPDGPGLTAWVAALQHGLTDEQLEAGFLAAPEYVQGHGGTAAGWLRGLYRDLLGRDADAAGLAYWADVLGAGAAPAQVAYGLAASPERAARRVTADYQQYLGRIPQAGEVSSWVNALQSGARNEDVVAGFLASEEYFQGHGGNGRDWLLQAYQDVLGRRPADAELGDWFRVLQGW